MQDDGNSLLPTPKRIPWNKGKLTGPMTIDEQADQKFGQSGSPLEVLLAFGKLGVTCFGGPIAHIGYFREEFVVRRAWKSVPESYRSQHAHIRLARIHQVIGDRSHAADRDHRGLLASILDAVVMRRARDPPHEAARRHWNRVVRLEVFPARHPPRA